MIAFVSVATSPTAHAETTEQFLSEVRPLIMKHCVECHSTAKVAGELDLEQFTTLGDAKRLPLIWESIAMQVDDGEMPPKDKLALSVSEKSLLLDWINRFLDEVALESAGDPGPVALRRLSGAEYTYSIHDLTGVESLDPAREFPVDGAAGEGFTNAGAALVMSPTMLTKYMDAAKEISRHAVLVPSGIVFSPSVSASDWANERLAAIRNFYARYARAEGATPVNLQGVQFDTNEGGRLPLEPYVAALNESREALENATLSISQLASRTGLNANEIRVWQQNLWRFTSVGHIGKVNGPKSWQESVDPLVESHTIRMPLSAPQDGSDLLLYLSTSDAGDGDENGIAVWDNPRLVIPGEADLPLRDLRSTWQRMESGRQAIISDTAKYLAAIGEISPSSTDEVDTQQLANDKQLNALALANWLNILGVHVGRNVVFDQLIEGRLESTPDYSFVKCWIGSDALGVLANSSAADVRVPGLLRAGSVAAHPSPTVAVVVAWRCPTKATVTVEGQLFDAHTDCGNGFEWALELRRGRNVRRLASGTSEGATPIPIGPLSDLSVDEGDAIAMVIGPKDGSHVCDLTAVDLVIRSETQIWNLAKDVLPDILSGNPHADSYQNDRVWVFAGEPVSGGNSPLIPQGSLLEKWQISSDATEREDLATQLQRLLASGDTDLSVESPDGMLRKLLRSFHGPLMANAAEAVGQSIVGQSRSTTVSLTQKCLGGIRVEAK